MSDELMELPDGWEWTSFEELAERIPNALKAGPFGSALKKSFYVPSGYKIYGQEQVINEDPFFGDYYIDGTRYEELKSCAVKPGDILISLVGTIGKVLILPKEIEPGIINPRLVKLSLDKILVNNEYVKKYLESPAARDYLSKLSHGGTMDILNLSILKTLKIPLPPLNEQKRIVAAIESLRERSQKARSTLLAIPELCNKFRQSVLCAAFRGDLTADWREQNPDIESGTNRWKIKSLSIESDNLPEIPEAWLYRRLDEISERVSVGHVGPTSEYYCDSTVGVPFLRSQNVRPGKLDLTGLQHITKDFHKQLRKSQLQPGDLLIVRVGANRGDTCILSNDIGAVNCANIVFARPFKGISDYLNIYFQSKFCQETLAGLTTGSAQGVINTKSVAEVPIPIPPEEEQEEIIVRIQALLTAIASVEQQHQQSIGRLEHLDRAILAKAFRGELVEQDPNDEPASVLLERIRVEREQQAQGKAKKLGKKADSSTHKRDVL